jgi:hypothetical protein
LRTIAESDANVLRPGAVRQSHSARVMPMQ